MNENVNVTALPESHDWNFEITIEGKTYFTTEAYSSEHYSTEMVHYVIVRDGHAFGSIRRAKPTAKSGTVGRKIYDTIKNAEASAVKDTSSTVGPVKIYGHQA